MYSEAKATGSEDLGFDGGVEAAERTQKTRGVRDNNGTAGDLAPITGREKKGLRKERTRNTNTTDLTLEDKLRLHTQNCALDRKN